MKRFGGTVEDFLPLHDFLDSSKAHFADIRHRAVLHNGFGIYLAEKVFGPVLEVGDGRHVPTRVVAERHVVEDLGRIPTLADWLRHMDVTPWTRRATMQMREYRTAVRVDSTNVAKPEGDRARDLSTPPPDIMHTADVRST